MTLYFDHMAATPLDPRVFTAMRPYFLQSQLSCNHAANHKAGDSVRQIIHDAKHSILSAVHATESHDIVFTSGATESINLCLLGMARNYQKQKNHIISFATEHSATLMCLQHLPKIGFEVTILPVLPSGHIDYELLAKSIQPNTLLISAVHVNNEIGVIHNLPHLVQCARDHGTLLHLDCAQSIGKTNLDLSHACADFVSLSAHKAHGPKGIGALLVRNRPKRKLEPLMYGQSQLNSFRPGTLPTPLIVGMAAAFSLATAELEARTQHVGSLHALFSASLPESVQWHGDRVARVPHNINISLPTSTPLTAIRALCDDFTLSQASSCSSHTSSHVLRALGLQEDAIHRALRISLSHNTTKRACQKLIQCILETL